MKFKLDELSVIFANLTDINVGLYIFLFVLLVLSAFFSSAETAFSSVNIIRLKNMIEEGNKKAKKALYISEHYDQTLSTILVGNNLVNIGMASTAAYVFTTLISNPTLANLYNTLIVTTLILIFGEILPKSFAKENAESLALIYSGIMYFLLKAMYPIVIIFVLIKKALFKNNSSDITSQPSVTEDELETIFDTMEEEGVLEEDEADMLQSVLDLSEKTVYDIMTPRVDVIAVDINDDIDEIKEVFFKYQYSRLPVYDKSRDKIVGILHERNFLTKLVKAEEFELKDIMSEPLYVTKSMKVDDLIELLQINKTHIAIVSDEFGGTSGIVTMEDALEELVGEIYDEHDDLDQEEILKINENRYHVSGDMDLDDLFEYLNLGKLPETKYTTVAGWLYELSEDIPEEDDRIDHTVTLISPELDLDEMEKILHFRVKKVTDRRIKSVILSIEDVTDEVKERINKEEKKEA